MKIELSKKALKVINRLGAKTKQMLKLAIYELIKCISPDDMLTEEDINGIKEARAEYERDETISASEVEW